MGRNPAESEVRRSPRQNNAFRALTGGLVLLVAEACGGGGSPATAPATQSPDLTFTPVPSATDVLKTPMPSQTPTFTVSPTPGETWLITPPPTEKPTPMPTPKVTPAPVQTPETTPLPSSLSELTKRVETAAETAGTPSNPKYEDVNKKTVSNDISSALEADPVAANKAFPSGLTYKQVIVPSWKTCENGYHGNLGGDPKEWQEQTCEQLLLTLYKAFQVNKTQAYLQAFKDGLNWAENNLPAPYNNVLLTNLKTSYQGI